MGTGHRAVSGASESAWSACTRRSQAGRRSPEVCGVSGSGGRDRIRRRSRPDRGLGCRWIRLRHARAARLRYVATTCNVAASTSPRTSSRSERAVAAARVLTRDGHAADAIADHNEQRARIPLAPRRSRGVASKQRLSLGLSVEAARCLARRAARWLRGFDSIDGTASHLERHARPCSTPEGTSLELIDARDAARPAPHAPLVGARSPDDGSTTDLGRTPAGL
jgi:hypothetical protein